MHSEIFVNLPIADMAKSQAFVPCDDQAEVDKLWDGLIADGGAPSAIDGR